MRESHETGSAEETQALGRNLAATLRPGDVIAFFGDLGSGKTTMIKGIAVGLQVKDVVRSPSFIVATHYDGILRDEPIEVHHIDLYRLRDASELAEIGFSDFVAGEGITLIEWAERAKMVLPESAIRVELELAGEQRRKITIHNPP
jgi:tRNA threonylcarbamoyladenosine biosynthesis protein TsaE